MLTLSLGTLSGAASPSSPNRLDSAFREVAILFVEHSKLYDRTAIVTVQFCHFN